jgi:hypothetical protein
MAIFASANARAGGPVGLGAVPRDNLLVVCSKYHARRCDCGTSVVVSGRFGSFPDATTRLRDRLGDRIGVLQTCGCTGPDTQKASQWRNRRTGDLE